MATVTKGKTFGTTEEVTAAKLHQLVDSATVTAIVNADIDASAAIDESKLDLTKTGSDANLVTGTAGTDGNLVKWNADGDAVDSTYGVLDEDNFASNSNTDVPTQQSTKAYVDALEAVVNALPFTESFESSEKNIPTAGAVRTFSHGLSGTPKIVQVFARCKTSEYNYAVGDEVLIGDYGDAGQTQNAYVNSTTIGWGHTYSGGNIVIKDRTLDKSRLISSPNWKLVIRAYA